MPLSRSMIALLGAAMVALAVSPPTAAPAAASAAPNLLAELDGWGEGTTGGAGGQVYRVTSDDNAGPGTLREALESDAPRIVVFDRDMTIKLTRPIMVRSNKTVDARGRDVRIDTNTRIESDECERPSGDDRSTTALKIVGQRNVILVNLDFDDDFDRWQEDCESSDAIYIEDSQYIWVHHCSFRRWADGAMDIKGSTERITVSWSRFQDIHQALLWTVDLVSFHHNRCQNVALRCPKLSGGRVHAFNNVIEYWDSSKIIMSSSGGQLWNDHNMFLHGDGRPVNDYGDDAPFGCIERTAPRAWADLRWIDVNEDGTPACRTIDATFKQDSIARSTVDRCGDDACWWALRTRIKSGDATHRPAGATR